MGLELLTQRSGVACSSIRASQVSWRFWFLLWALFDYVAGTSVLHALKRTEWYPSQSAAFMNSPVYWNTIFPLIHSCFLLSGLNSRSFHGGFLGQGGVGEGELWSPLCPLQAESTPTVFTEMLAQCLCQKAPCSLFWWIFLSTSRCQTVTQMSF